MYMAFFSFFYLDCPLQGILNDLSNVGYAKPGITIPKIKVFDDIHEGFYDADTHFLHFFTENWCYT